MKITIWRKDNSISCIACIRVYVSKYNTNLMVITDDLQNQHIERLDELESYQIELLTVNDIGAQQNAKRNS